MHFVVFWFRFFGRGVGWLSVFPSSTLFFFFFYSQKICWIKIEGRGLNPVTAETCAAQLNPSVLLQLHAKLLTQMSLDLLKAVALWTGAGGQWGWLKGGVLRSSASDQQTHWRIPLASAWWSSKKNPPPVQIRSPNLHISSFPQCSLWWSCAAGKGLQWEGGGGGGAREGQEEVTTLTQGGTASCSLFTSFSHSVCLHKWDNRVMGGGDWPIMPFELWQVEWVSRWVSRPPPLPRDTKLSDARLTQNMPPCVVLHSSAVEGVRRHSGGFVSEL